MLTRATDPPAPASPGLEARADPDAPAGHDFSVSFRDAKEDAIARFERSYVRALLALHDGNLSRAARAVRMDRNHLRDLARRHDIPIRGA